MRTLGGIPRVFAEYVESGILEDWIDSRKLYEGAPQEALKRTLDIAIQITWGLQNAHEKGVIHQDVKPANVMLLADGTAKITDFGLAKARAVGGENVQSGKQQSVLVSSGGMTPTYCSPEQAANQPLSRRTDTWSWSLAVLEMFIGEVCWQNGVTAPEVLANWRELRIQEIGCPELPPELEQLLQQRFFSDPAQRPANLTEAATRLREVCKALTQQNYDRVEPEPGALLADARTTEQFS